MDVVVEGYGFLRFPDSCVWNVSMYSYIQSQSVNLSVFQSFSFSLNTTCSNRRRKGGGPHLQLGLEGRLFGVEDAMERLPRFVEHVKFVGGEERGKVQARGVHYRIDIAVRVVELGGDAREEGAQVGVL